MPHRRLPSSWSGLFHAPPCNSRRIKDFVVSCIRNRLFCAPQLIDALIYNFIFRSESKLSRSSTVRWRTTKMGCTPVVNAPLEHLATCAIFQKPFYKLVKFCIRWSKAMWRAFSGSMHAWSPRDGQLYASSND